MTKNSDATKGIEMLYITKVAIWNPLGRSLNPQKKITKRMIIQKSLQSAVANRTMFDKISNSDHKVPAGEQQMKYPAASSRSSIDTDTYSTETVTFVDVAIFAFVLSVPVMVKV